MNSELPVVGRGFCYEDLPLGTKFRTHRRTIAESDLTAFVNLTWLTEELFAVEEDQGRAIKVLAASPLPDWSPAHAKYLDKASASLGHTSSLFARRADKRPSCSATHTPI